MVESDIVGREIQADTNNLVESLVREDNPNCYIFAVVGMGGIGKTTLAQKIFNDRRIQSKFPKKAWVCVSKEFQETKLLREIIRLVGGELRGAETKAELLPLLRDVVSGKSFFLVLDDVWSADVWVDLLRYSLQSGATTDGCRVLVTTRDVNVATAMGAMHIHSVQHLQLESGWELLSKSVFKNGEEEGRSLKDVGIQIVQKCHGLPLAIKVVAGLLIGKTRKEWEDIVRNEVWSTSALPEELRGALYLSYEDLPSYLKQCFLYLALFPEDYVYRRVDLVRMWVAEGFVERRATKLMEDLAEDYYEELIRRNLLQQDFKFYDNSRCTLHDLLRSLAQLLSREESFYGDPQELSTATTSVKLRRLSVSDNRKLAAIPESIMKQEGLRTLVLLRSPPRFEDALFARLPYLRVLLLNGEAIKSIPDSLGELVHLRLLDLDRTSISNLPESIGRLTNLEILNLQGCQSLHTLPKAITRLCNLRRLGLVGTPLSFVPEGIGRLQKLNDLGGFFAGTDSMVNGHQERGCSLEELSPLSELRELFMVKLERAQIRTGASSPLTNKPYFRRLRLACTPQTSGGGGTTPYTEEDVNRIETLFEELLLPHSLEKLYVRSFFGRQYPSWMMSPSLATCLPCLIVLQLINCLSCPQLPPLGELRQLRYLRIEGASAVVTIGPEFLLKKMRPANLVAFPKLEVLLFVEMPNWEEWSFGREVEGQSDDNSGGGPASLTLDVLPCLRSLTLTDCPKLGALPGGLERSPIKRLFIERAHSLKRVNSIPSLTDVLEIENNRCLEALSHLPALRVLNAFECPALKFVGNLDALQLLYLRDGSMECLPGWLITLLQQRQRNSLHDNLELNLDSNIRLLERCSPGNEDWSIIQQIPWVAIYQVDGNGRLTYSKEPYSCETNVRF